MEDANPKSINDLLALLGLESYDAFVTDQQFWMAVGEILQRRRLRLGMKSTNAVAAHGGPTYKTVSEIEAGRVGQLTALQQYATAVRLSVTDIFRAVLNADRRQLGPELEEIIRKYEGADTDGRLAIHAVAKVVRPRVPDSEMPDAPLGSPPHTPPPAHAPRPPRARK